MMSDTEFTMKYQPVLQSIETSIVDLYRAHPNLTDANVDKVVESLVRKYTAKQRNRTIPAKHLNELQDQLFAQIRTTCDWCLGIASSRTPKQASVSRRRCR